MRGPWDGFRRASFSAVEGDAIQVEPERLVVLDERIAFGRAQRRRALVLGVSQVRCPPPGEDDVATVGTPRRIALDERRVVRTAQRTELTALAVEHAQDSLDGEEQLREGQRRPGDEDRQVPDGAHDVAPVRRDLGQQAEGRAAVLPALVVVPGDDVPRGQRHVLLDVGDDVRRLGIGVVHVHREGGAVATEGVTVGADGHAFENDRWRLRRADGPEPPADVGGVLVGVDERQVDLAEKQRRPDGILGRAKGDCGLRQDLHRAATSQTQDEHSSVSFE